MLLSSRSHIIRKTRDNPTTASGPPPLAQGWLCFVAYFACQPLLCKGWLCFVANIAYQPLLCKERWRAKRVGVVVTMLRKIKI